MTTSEIIRRQFDSLCDIALAEVERLARRVMFVHPEVTDFYMANGSVAFDLDNGEMVGVYEYEPAAELNAFLDEWDDVFGLSGCPMWITGHDGEKKTNWGTGGKP